MKQIFNDFEYREAQNAYQQESKITFQSKEYQSKYYIQERIYNKWIESFSKDYLHLLLGNSCIWCERTNQQIELEIDHIFPKFRFGQNNLDHPTDLVKEFENGIKLRLLCFQCHAMRHNLA